jgi:serine phosphatase RsbU (regulator of sigma subunit)
MKRLAIWMTVLGPSTLSIAFYFLMLVYPAGEQPAYIVNITVPLLILGVISTFMGPVFFAFPRSLEKRKRIANVILIIALSIILLGYLSKRIQLPGASVEIIFGVFIFSFSYLTLLLKNKYDRWTVYTRSKRDAFFLSLTDSLGFSGLFLGALFKVLHWPGGTFLVVGGGILIIVGMIAWNQRMKREVIFRKETEDKLQDSYRQIEEKNKEITDSITYAKRIQQSLLAHDSQLQKNLNDFFVLYIPKDIVSGDFYWCTETADSFYLAVCDSTGHGVPGAFMSLLNISFLNEAITEKKIQEPNLILDHTRNLLISNLSQNDSKDGMDGILLRIEKQNRRITYAAANNAPLIVRNGIVEELPLDKMPIGKGERVTPFSLHTLDTNGSDLLYLTTDGFADQFGGVRGKKFKRSGLKELVKQHSTAPVNTQHEHFSNAFGDWKGDLEQVDDVLIVGIRF